MGSDFPGGPVAKTPAPNAGGLGSIPVQGTKSHLLQLKLNSTKQNKMSKCFKKYMCRFWGRGVIYREYCCMQL